MHLYTTYSMMQENGMVRTDPLFRELCSSIGSPRNYGPDKPIDVSMMLNLDRKDIRDPLWSLGCVYPEQAVAASRIARRSAILAYNIAAGRYPTGSYRLLDRSVRTANEYLAGGTDSEVLTKYRRKLWDASYGFKSPCRNLFTLAWIACAAPDRIARIVHAAPEAVRHSVPSEHVHDRMITKLQAKAETEMIADLQQMLSHDRFDSEPGPGEMVVQAERLRMGA